MENAHENHCKDWTLLVANEKKLWKKLQVSQGKVQLLILQIANHWEIVAIENKTKATLYDEFIEQFLIKMGELLEEARAEFKRWHFEQTRNYTNALHHKFMGFMGSFESNVKLVISWVHII
jgi:mevalonate kinase